MAATLIDGVAIARRLTMELTVQVTNLAKIDLVPRLAVVLVGDDPASRTYVRTKKPYCAIGRDRIA